MKRLLVIYGMLLVAGAQAQPSRTDSLLREMHRATQPAKKLDLMLAVCSQNDIHLDTFNKYAFIVRELARKNGDPAKIAYAEYMVAYAYYFESDNDSARIIIDAALKAFKPATTEDRKTYYRLTGLKAITYQGERDHAAALQVLYPLLTETEKHNDSVFIAQTMHQIAIVEGQQNHPEKLIALERKALGFLPANDKLGKAILPTIYATLGKAYWQQENTDSATFYHLKAISIFRETEDLYNLPIVLQRQANVYISLKDARSAKAIIDELTGLNDRTGVGEGDLNFHLTFINYYMLTGQYEKAIALCNQHLYGDKAINNTNIRMSYLEALGKSYKATGKLDMYAKTLEELLVARDSFYADNEADAIAEMQTQYEVQKKENTIIAQKLDITRKNTLFYGSLGLLLSAGIITWLLFRNYRRKSRIKLFLMQEEDKRLATQAVKDAEEKERKRIAADLHDNLGSYAASIKANADDMLHAPQQAQGSLQLLQTNAQQMVSLLGDTIWALRKDAMTLSNISDRIKVFLQRIRPNYPKLTLRVEEQLDNDIQLPPLHAYHLFMSVQEAVNNALRHSGATEIVVRMVGSPAHWAAHVIDNGKGMSVTHSQTEGGNGLHNMQTRAATIQAAIDWRQSAGGGTEVIISSNTF